MAKRILLVEDDADMQHYFSIILSDTGYELLNAANGAEALELLDGGTPVDLVLLDLVMPVMSGEELFRILRQERALDVPILISSVDETRAEPLHAIGRVDGIFLKGMGGAELLRLLAEHLGPG